MTPEQFMRLFHDKIERLRNNEQMREHLFLVADAACQQSIIFKARDHISAQFNNITTVAIDAAALNFKTIIDLPDSIAAEIANEALPPSEDWKRAIDRLNTKIDDKLPKEPEHGLCVIFIQNAEALYDDLGYEGVFKRRKIEEAQFRGTFYETEDVRRIMLIQLSETPVDDNLRNKIYARGPRYSIKS